MAARITDLLSIGATGEIAGSATVANAPSVSCRFVKFKAVRSNAGNVYIGVNRSQTKVAGTTNTLAGWELDAGEETDWLPAANLSEFWYIGDNAGDDLVYITLVG